MKIHWIFKYYFTGFIIIFSIFYYIESSEPYVDWSLYSDISKNEVRNIIKNKECEELVKLYKNEYDNKYIKNFLGFAIRKEKKLTRGDNLLKYLDYNLKNINCLNI